MQTIIHHRGTGEFLCSKGRWSFQAEEALAFPSPAAAWTFIWRCGLLEVETITLTLL
jgi:hypothetical protein